MSDRTFIPFYEALVRRFPVPFFGKLAVSLFLGLLYLVPHVAVVRGEFLTDWSWFLAPLISVAMLCLYYATHTLLATFPEMDSRLGAVGSAVYLDPLMRVLSDRRFVLAGVVFGVLNCVVGYTLGIRQTGAAVYTIQWGYFIAGFVCGMAVYGIYGTLISINAFGRNAKGSLDFTSPDRCGGTVFLGEAIVVFSSVTLIVGVMISVYILKVNWTHGDAGLTKGVKGFWVAFPYLMSIVALIGPAIGINAALREYKLTKMDDLREKMTAILKQLDGDEIDSTARDALRKRYEFLSARREDVHKMRTWPYGLGANLKYLTVFISNSWATMMAVRGAFGKGSG